MNISTLPLYGSMPLIERIGHPDLYVQRQTFWNEFLQWTEGIPHLVSKSRAILARKKSGKTAFVQRLFNHLWNLDGEVIPFYFEVSEKRQWLGTLGVRYFETFASHYIAFVTRNPTSIRQRWRLSQIARFLEDHGAPPPPFLLLKEDVAEIQTFFKDQNADLLWEVAYSAPDRYATGFDQRFLVILDEFQFLGDRIYTQKSLEGEPDPSIPGSFHELSESKFAPMLATGSYVGWLLNIIGTHLEGGRLEPFEMPTAMEPEEGLEVVFRLSEHLSKPVTNQTAMQINELCKRDPFFIRCVIGSSQTDRDLTTEAGVNRALQHEIESRSSQLNAIWEEYIRQALDRINQLNAKKILWFLTKNRDRSYTHREIQAALKLDLELDDILNKCNVLYKADLILKGKSEIEFQGLQDGTLELVLNSRFHTQIEDFAINWEESLQDDWQSWKHKYQTTQGRYNALSGKLAEYLLANELRMKPKFKLSEYFEGVNKAHSTANEPITFETVQTGVLLQNHEGVTPKTFEIDVKADAQNDVRTLLVEVKKRQKKVADSVVMSFMEKVRTFAEQNPDRTVIAAIWSWNGFTESALALCRTHQIATASTSNIIQDALGFQNL